ncbi:MAG: ABC transporter ATP-binding protein [Daejeonella sp.]
MNEVVIKVSNLSKAYRIGLKEQQHDTLGSLVASWVKSPLKNFKRLRGLAEINLNDNNPDVFWALKDINFEVKRGEVLGIIGKNGAGKSTLLKILSRITEPSTGRVEIYGRVASLLEVGTGFNPELTGRENVYLNGTILGMTRKEIDRKFDEIVEFSGVEKFIDTPVKRYSSGMKVRLAFAVAAHLEPDILIIDEVLAVGDAEFQKKCLGKIQDVAGNNGRTVLFVSHDMKAISGLCSWSFLLVDGQIEKLGNTNDVIDHYLRNFDVLDYKKEWPDQENAPGDSAVKLRSIQAIDESGMSKKFFDITGKIGIKIDYVVYQPTLEIWHGLNFFNAEGVNLFDSHNVTSDYYNKPHSAGHYTITAWIPGNFLAEGKVILNIAIFNHTNHFIHLHEKEVISFDVVDYLRTDVLSSRGRSTGKFPGVVRPLLIWK